MAARGVLGTGPEAGLSGGQSTMTRNERHDDEAADHAIPVGSAREASEAPLGWIRRFADQWAESRRGDQKAHDLPGDSLRK